MTGHRWRYNESREIESPTYIDAPRESRGIAAHQFKARKNQAAENETILAVTRECARRLLGDQLKVEGMMNLVSDQKDNFWDKKKFWEKRRKKRVKMFQEKCCPPMKKVRRGDKLP